MGIMMNLFENGNRIGDDIAKMTSMELSALCDTLFRKNPATAEWIIRDLEHRIYDKAITDAGVKYDVA